MRALMKKKLMKELHVLGRKTEKIHRGEKREFVQHALTSAQGGHNLHHKKGILKGG